ncbi:MAG: YhdP family protein [Betaproteobacteria bacterium]
MAPSLSLRLLRIAGTSIVALVVAFCTLLLAIRFVVLPGIDDYRDRIAAELSSQLGQPVAIAGIAGGWDGWNPRLSITGFAIHDRAHPTGKPVLLLPQVDLTVAWTSLAALDLRLRELSIARPELSVRRDTLGRLHIAGIEIDPEAQGDDSRFMDWLLRQRQIVVHDALLSWTDELRGAPQLVLDKVMFRLEQSFGHHKFGLVGSPPSALASPLDFRGEVTADSFKDWRDAKGRFYVRLDYADVALWREWIPLLRPVESGQGALRVWFDFANSAPTNIVADLELTGVRARVASNLPLLDLTHLGGRVKWASGGGKREFTAQGLTFRTQSGEELAPVTFTATMTEGADGAITGGQMAFDRLEVQPLSKLAEHLPLPEQWRRDLAVLALRGSVTGGKYAWTGPPDEPTRYSGSGAFTQFGIAASESLPGAASVSGNFTFDEAKGDLKLDSRDMRVSLPRVFAGTLVFDVASGRVGWSRGQEGLRITIDDVRFVTPHTSGTASGSWRARPQGPGLIELKAQLARADAQNLYNYLPLTLDRNVRDWLRQSITKGTASDIRIALAGDLADFPFADSKRGQFLVTFKTAGVTLDYANGWPEVTELDADVKFEGTGLAIDARRGRIAGVQTGPVTAEIVHLGVPFPVLTIAGEASGTTTEFLHFIATSPVSEWTGHATAGAQATGNGKLTLRFSLPLGKGEDVKVAGDYQLVNNQLRLPGMPALAQVNGYFGFSDLSMQSHDLTAEAFGGTMKLAVASGEGRVRVNASGTANLAAVKAELDLPLLHRVSGATEWQLAATTGGAATTWTLESSLKGVAVDLPAPLGKLAIETAALKVERREVAGKPQEDLLTIDYRSDLRVLAHRINVKDSATVDRALLLLGAAIARGGAADRPGLWVRGQLADFDFDEWMALYAKESPKSAATGTATPPRPANAFELNGVDVEAGRLDVFGRVLHDIKVIALRADGDWRLRLAGSEVEGTAVWRGPAPGLPNGRVMARLSRFASPGPDELHPARSEVDSSEKAKNTWPELDIQAESFFARGHDLGKFDLLAQPAGPDWRISKLALTSPAGRIDGSGWWRVGRDKPTTEIDVALSADDAGAFLDRFGYPVAVKNAPTKIAGKLTWNGAPNDFDYPTLDGNFTLKTGAGQFTKIDPGIGKLLSLLSLQALPRRLTLDFRDVFSEGFAFDDIAGDFNLVKGMMHTESLKLDGPAATVNITGDIDLASETTRLDVRVKPALSTTFSAGAAALFIANPLVGAAVAAGTLLAQKLMDNPLGQIFSYDYRITGSWSDPQVERVGAKAESNSADAAGAERPTR